MLSQHAIDRRDDVLHIAEVTWIVARGVKWHYGSYLVHQSLNFVADE